MNFKLAYNVYWPAERGLEDISQAGLIFLCATTHLLSYINSEMIMQLIRNGYNHDTGRKFGNLIVVLKKFSARFQLENWSVPARLGSARNIHSSGLLEPENSSSNPSLVNTHDFMVFIFALYLFGSICIKLFTCILVNCCL